MNSKEAKLHFLTWLRYYKNCWAVFTEYVNNSDVFGVNKSGYKIEIEIKVNKSDLQKELKCIRTVWDYHNSDDPPSDLVCGKHGYKCDKHNCYLFLDHEYVPRPKYFYLGVTKDLMDIAKKGIKDTPYGLLVITEYNDVVEMVAAKSMKSDKFTNWKHAAIKASVENINLRQTLLSLENS